MIDITNELKAKLLAAKSAEEVTELLKADGQEITPEDAAHLWEEIERKRNADGKELSPDELEAVSGGSNRDFLKDGCAATVEPGSWCWSDDSCAWVDVKYDNEPVGYCPYCGGRQVVNDGDGVVIYRLCTICHRTEEVDDLLHITWQ